MLLEGQVIGGQYRLEEFLHNGGATTVWIGSHLETGRRSALKILNQTLPDLPRVSEWFVTQGRGAMSPRHPMILAAEAVGQVTAQGPPFVVIELLEGASLRQILDEGGPLSLPRAVAIIRRTLEGLSVAHRQGAAHGNLKPGNLFLCAQSDLDEPLRLLNFGLSRPMLAAQNARTPTLILGTLDYVPPEGLRRPDLPPTTTGDVFACGVILGELLTGHPPLAPLRPHDQTISTKLEDRNNYYSSGHSVPLPSQTLPDLPAKLDHLIQRATLVDPTQRYAQAEQMLQALYDVIAEDRELASATIHDDSTTREARVRADLAQAAQEGLVTAKTVVQSTSSFAMSGTAPLTADEPDTLLLESEAFQEELRTTVMSSSSPPPFAEGPAIDSTGAQGDQEALDDESDTLETQIPPAPRRPPQAPLGNPFEADTEPPPDSPPPFVYARTMILEPPSSPAPAAKAPAPRVPAPIKPDEGLSPAKTMIYEPPSSPAPPAPAPAPAATKPAGDLPMAKTMVFDPEAGLPGSAIVAAPSAAMTAPGPSEPAGSPGSPVPPGGAQGLQGWVGNWQPAAPTTTAEPPSNKKGLLIALLAALALVGVLGIGAVLVIIFSVLR